MLATEGSMPSQRILVLYAHAAPHRSRVNRRLADAAREVANVYVHDLYETYPDFYIDVAREQALVERADIVAFVHPFQWYSMPALLKEWIDVVLEKGWAYGDGATALQGKGYWLVTTTGSRAESYQAEGRHGHSFDAFLPQFAQTAALCGMRWLPPHVLHAAHHVDADVLDAHIAAFAARLRTYAGDALLAPTLETRIADGRP